MSVVFGVILSFLFLVVLGIPICFSLGGAAIVYFLFVNPNTIMALPARVFAGTNSFILISLPLFILAGELMNNGGITKRIVDFSLFLVKPIKGGLAEVNVVASMIFGGITGSSVADTSAVGGILIPSMEREGYSRNFSAGVTVASSTMGMIIPPSIPMLVYAVISSESVGSLFLAGAIPGILIGISQLILVSIISRRKGYGNKNNKFSMYDFWITFRGAFFAILMPLMIVLSISLGVCTATESAALAVLYALIIDFFVYRELRLGDIPRMLKNTIVMTSSVMLIVAFAQLFTWVLAMIQVPAAVGAFFESLTLNRILILLILNALILGIGTFLDVTPTLLLLGPILMPIMEGLGVGRLQFGTIMIVGLAVSLVTPPVALCLNACTKICGLPMGKIFASALPFLICNVIVLVLVTLIPELSLWLPNLVMK